MKRLNQKGNTLLGAVAALGAIGFASVAVFNLVSVDQDATVTIAKDIAAVDVGSYVQQQTQKVFMDTKDLTTKRNTDGMCSYVGFDSATLQEDSVMVDVTYRIEPFENPLFSAERWERYLPGFEVIQPNEECNPPNGYGVCLRVKESGHAKDNTAYNAKELVDQDLVIQINIDLVKTNPLSSEPFSLTKSLKRKAGDDEVYWNLKSVGYDYTIRLHYNNREVEDENGNSTFTRKASVFKGFIWAGDLNICYEGDKNIAVVGTGFGDTSGNTYYSKSGFIDEEAGEKTNKTPFEIREKHLQITSGEIEGNIGSQLISSSALTFSSCNEVSYQCPQKTAANKRSYGRMKIDYALKYEPTALRPYMSDAEYSSIKDEVTFNPDISIISESGKNELRSDGFETAYTVGGNTYEKDKNGNYYLEGYDAGISDYRLLTNIPLKVLATSRQHMTAEIYDSNAVREQNSSNKICRQICVPETDYNTSSNNRKFVNVITRLKLLDTPDGMPKEFKNRAASPVSCTACYTKSCTRYGLGTFGAMNEIPTEPLDAGFPICVQHNNDVMTQKSDLMDKAKGDGVRLPAGSENKCISYKMKNGSGEGFIAKAEDCSAKKQILCFNYGKHILAEKLNPTSRASEITGEFSEASNHCFNTGREILKTNSLGELFAQQATQGNANHVSFLEKYSGNADFINLARQGIFLAPVGINQENTMRKYAASGARGQSFNTTDFWVNLKTDGLGFVYAPAPLLSKESMKAENIWSGKYNTVSKFILSKNENDLSKLPLKGDYGVLYHSVRHRGLHFVKGDNPFDQEDEKKGRLRVLCMTDFGDAGQVKIVSNSNLKKTKGIAGAHDICRSEGAYFVPPTTTGQWVKALHDIITLEAMSSIPIDISDTEEGTYEDPVWVALKRNPENGEISIYSKYDSTILSGTDGEFISVNGSFFVPPVTPEGEDPPALKERNFCMKIDSLEFKHQEEDCNEGFTPVSKTILRQIKDGNIRQLKIALIKSFETMKADSSSDLLKLKIVD